LADPSHRTPDLPLLTVMCNATGQIVQVTDIGRAMVTGKCGDIGKFKGPILRGLAGRAPYFHNGSAATLMDAVSFYDTRFNLHLSQQDKDALGALMFAGGKHEELPPSLAQVVALDECDPGTFHAALGPDFCKNVALGAATKLSDLFAKAAAGTPDSGWDFDPDTLIIKKGTTLTVVDQGGEPHTFTEVAQFGGGFLPVLN